MHKGGVLVLVFILVLSTCKVIFELGFGLSLVFHLFSDPC
tara:strand:- start:1124 stop:1243 length:120 start_codon:yes stop_codon:yes gene_type:complete